MSSVIGKAPMEGQKNLLSIITWERIIDGKEDS